MTSQAKGFESTNVDVQEYYGKTVTKTDDLELKACTQLPTKLPKYVRQALSEVADEVSARYYGCGLILPEVLEGKSILDLGSGAGRDCYMLSKLVGEKGNVVGIDMTEEQLECANRYHEYHREKYGYSKANTKFVKGFIEKLIEAGCQENYFDIIVSNCVINLSPDKKAVLTDAYKVLKDGGELYFSDIYADRDLPEEVRKHKVLWGECISGALWWKDLYTLAKDIGFTAPRLVTANYVNIDKPELKAAVGDAEFVSVTYRLFKMPKESTSEASEMIYDGDIRGCEDTFKFDHKYTFQREEMKVVDGDTASILLNTRFSEYFSTGNAKPKCCPNPSGKDEQIDPFQYVKDEGLPAAGCCDTATKCC